MFGLIYTSVVVLLITLALLFEVYKPSVILFTGLIFLYLGGILTVEQSIEGFSNEGMLTLAFLFIIAKALQNSTGFATFFSRWMQGEGKRVPYLRLMLPISVFSSVLNNTAVVAAYIPYIRKWGRRRGIALSKLLIPVSYAAIVGGICTLTGSSTNLLVHGFLLDQGFEGLGFFELAIIGMPIALLTLAYFSLGSGQLLPSRPEMKAQLSTTAREFVVQVKVTHAFKDCGLSISNAGLRHLKGLFLFQIVREGKVLAPVSPTEHIEEGDRLFFTGMTDTIYELVQLPGLQLVKDNDFNLQDIDSDRVSTYEAVISNSSPLVGESVRDSSFRTKYNAVILAIHRNGQRLNDKIGNVILQPNDTIFLLADKEFGKRWYHSTDFSLVSDRVVEYSKPRWMGNLAMLLFLLMVTSYLTGIIPSLLMSASIVAGILIFTKVISLHDAKLSIDFNILLSIAVSIGIGKAIQVSGLSDLLATHLVYMGDNTGPIGVIIALFLATVIYTELVTNAAAAAFAFPVALSVAGQMGVDPRPYILVITVGASLSFMSPIGYQTNMMVYSAGGYRYTDFLRTGWPVTLLSLIYIAFWAYFVLP